MVSQGVMMKIKDHLPWRVRRRLQRWELAALRHAQPQGPLFVRGGSPAASLVAVGDIALSGFVGGASQRHNRHPWFREINKIFEGCNLRIGNLETVLTEAQRQNGLLGSFLKASPRALEILTGAGFNALSLANNHARDCGLEALLHCRDLLHAHGIRSCGAGSTLEEARSPAILKVAGLRIAMLGYCDNFRVSPIDAENASPPQARDDWIEEDIRSLRPAVDLLILQLHWGWEFSFYPPLSYRDRARRFAELGADLVLCHHAHIPMGIEVWKGSIIAHGLGNFIFPRDKYLMDGHPWTYRTIALKAHFNNRGLLSAEVIPCVIDESGLPRVAVYPAAAEILGAVRRASMRLNDTAFLSRVERDRTVRETLAFFRGLQRSDLSTALEWALQPLSPFKQDVVRRLERDHGAAGKRLAEFIRGFAASRSDHDLLRLYRDMSKSSAILAALAELQTLDPPTGGVPGSTP